MKHSVRRSKENLFNLIQSTKDQIDSIKKNLVIIEAMIQDLDENELYKKIKISNPTKQTTKKPLKKKGLYHYWGWTPEQISKLREEYPTCKDLEKLAKELGRPLPSVRVKASQLKIRRISKKAREKQKEETALLLVPTKLNFFCPHCGSKNYVFQRRLSIQKVWHKAYKCLKCSKHFYINQSNKPRTCTACGYPINSENKCTSLVCKYRKYAQVTSLNNESNTESTQLKRSG